MDPWGKYRFCFDDDDIDDDDDDFPLEPPPPPPFNNDRDSWPPLLLLLCRTFIIYLLFCSCCWCRYVLVLVFSAVQYGLYHLLLYSILVAFTTFNTTMYVWWMTFIIAACWFFRLNRYVHYLFAIKCPPLTWTLNFIYHFLHRHFFVFNCALKTKSNES